MNKSRLLNDAIWIVLGRVGIGISLLMTVRLLTDRVAPMEYGIFALLISLSGLAFNIAFYPLNLAAQRFFPPSLNNGTNGRLLATLFRIRRRRHLMAVGFVVLGYLGLCYFDLLPFDILLLTGTIFITLVTGHRSLFTFILEAKRNQRLSSIWKVSETFLKMLFALMVVVLLGPSAGSILIGFILGFIFPLIFFLRREGTKEFVLDTYQDKIGPSISKFMLPLAFAGSMTWFVGFSDRFVLAALTSQEEVGVYYATYSLVSFPMLQLGGIFATLIQPIYFRYTSIQERHLLLWLMVLAASIIPLLLLVYFYSDFIALLFLGEQFRSGSDLMIWIAAGYGLLSLNIALDARMLADQYTRLLTSIMIVAALSNIGLNLILVPILGAKGAAIGTFFTFAIQISLSALAVLYLNRRQRENGAG